jgi:hypothetical protein
MFGRSVLGCRSIAQRCGRRKPVATRVRGCGERLVGDQQFRREALLLEKLAHQPQHRSAVAAALDQHVQDLALRSRNFFLSDFRQRLGRNGAAVGNGWRWRGGQTCRRDCDLVHPSIPCGRLPIGPELDRFGRSLKPFRSRAVQPGPLPSDALRRTISSEPDSRPSPSGSCAVARW